jgi:hypothetical protein
MTGQPISLNEASWRLEKSGISGLVFAELLLKSPPILLGIRPGYQLHDPVDLSRVTSFRAEPENAVVADALRWTDIKLDWAQLVAAFKRRGCTISWTWFSDITPGLLERSRQPGSASRFSGDWRPRMQKQTELARRAQPDWFEGSEFTMAVPVSGKPTPARRGPKSGKRTKAAAAIFKDLEDGTLTTTALRAMPEKLLAARYGVHRDTARKAKNDALSLVEKPISTNDK